MDANLEDNSSLERAKQSAAWVAAYMGKEISRCSEADKLMAIEAFPTFANAIPIESDGESASAFDRAQTALRWVSAYMGKDIARCDEADKLRALKAFGQVRSAMDASSLEEAYDLAIQGTRWISSYIGKEIKFCTEDDKSAAMTAYAQMANVMGVSSSGEALNALQQQNMYNQAQTALRWIESYTGKDIKYCSEEEKRIALNAYSHCSETMAMGQYGQHLDLVEQQDMLDGARRALAWISEYTGKDIKHCDEDAKREALAAYRNLSKAGCDDARVKELEDQCEFLESLAEQYREEYMLATAPTQLANEDQGRDEGGEITWLQEELDVVEHELARHRAAEDELSWLQAEALKDIEAAKRCAELEVTNGQLELRIRELEDELSWALEDSEPDYDDADDLDASYQPVDYGSSSSNSGMWF